MKIAFYGSSLISAYWNGAATYYRGMLKALAQRGYAITFYEPDAYDRQNNRDMDPPDWAKVVVYSATYEAVRRVTGEAAGADIVVKASGVGVFDDELLTQVMSSAHPSALRVYWDVDAPATLATIRRSEMHPLRTAVPDLDLILTYGGGPPVVAAYQALGAKICRPLYNALDPDSHHPVPPDARFASDLAFLGNRLPDREERVEEFFLRAARLAPSKSFLLGGAGWGDKPLPENVRLVGHVPTTDHNAFNVTPRAVLNVNRSSMAEIGYSPPTRVFEAAGAGSCLITDAWEGIDQFLKPDDEVLVARDGQDVAEYIQTLDVGQAKAIGHRARERILREHTYDKRAVEADRLFRALSEVKREEALT